MAGRNNFQVIGLEMIIWVVLLFAFPIIFQQLKHLAILSFEWGAWYFYGVMTIFYWVPIVFLYGRTPASVLLKNRLVRKGRSLRFWEAAAMSVVYPMFMTMMFIYVPMLCFSRRRLEIVLPLELEFQNFSKN